MSWTIEDLRKLDLKYAREGVHMHQRPSRAAMELLGSAFSIGNPAVREIMDAFRAMVPEARTSWPGMGIGLAVSVDQVRKAVASVTFGTFQGPAEAWKPLGFQTEKIGGSGAVRIKISRRNRVLPSPISTTSPMASMT